MAFRKILVAIDESALAAHAAEAGAELARALGAEVALINVVDPDLSVAPESGIPTGELIRQAEQDGKRMVAAYCQRLSLPRPPLEFVPVGKPAAEIVNAAKNWPADLIVIASHGHSGVRRALLGSVAEAVARHAPCPVLIVRGQA